jgi:C-terminal processing protease CtpA/Prc
MKSWRWAASGLGVALALSVVALRAAAQPHDGPIDAATRAAVVDRLSAVLRERYVFPAKVPAVERELRAKLKSGAYAKAAGANEFAQALTDDVLTVLHDKHVRIRFRPEGIPAQTDADQPSPDEIRRQNEEEARTNYGFERLQRLRGNIGYLDLRGFSSASLSARTLASTMEFLSHTQSLIVDLRRNGGGDPETIALFCSYLFPPGTRVHVNDLAMRQGSHENVEQYWTSQVPGPYYVDKPVYVLTSSRTFSGGEEFAYDLQNLKRATLVGETTGGGANPGDFVRLTEHFGAFIPTGRAISPITHANWEGVGVKPDVPTAAADALKTAYLALLRKRVLSVSDPDEKAALSDLIAQVDRQGVDRVLED